MSSGLPADFLLVSRLVMILSRFCCSEADLVVSRDFSADSLLLGSAPIVAALGLLPPTTLAVVGFRSTVPLSLLVA